MAYETISSIAQTYGLKRHTLLARMKKRAIPHIKDGNRYCVPLTHVDALIGKKRSGIHKHPLYHRWFRASRRRDTCHEWKMSFDRFVDDVGPQPYFGAALVRVIVSEGYKPGNTVWK